MNKKFEKQIRFLQRRLSPEGYAGLHLTIGALIVLICGCCFGALAEDVSENEPIVQIDQQVAIWFNQHATPPITRVVSSRSTASFASSLKRDSSGSLACGSEKSCDCFVVASGRMADSVGGQNYENQRTKFPPTIAADFSPSDSPARPDARAQHVDL